MYISLNKLSQEDTTAGELVAAMLGKAASPTDEMVKDVVAAMNIGFNIFKDDNDVVSVLSFRDRWFNEDQIEGEAGGKTKDAARLAELIKSGILIDEALQMIEEEVLEEASVWV